MCRYCRWALLILALPLHFSLAVEGKKTTGKPNEVLAYFHDGTRVRTVIQQDNLEIMTRYGKLTVPTAEVRRIDFGFRLPEATARRVQEAVQNLGNSNFQLRETATKDLIALGRLAYPALLRAAKDGDLEATRRIEEVLKAIREKVPAEQLRSRTEDLIYTVEFTIAGRIEAPLLKARTEHFGEVQLKVADLRSLESTTGGTEVKLAVDAAIYGSNNTQWLDTRYMVTADVPLLITAAGEIDLYGNQSPGQYLSGPEGNRNVGRAGTHIPGMLLGKIGEDGPVFIVAKKYEGTPVQEGKLYLRIVPIQGSGGSTGSFQIKINAGNYKAPE